MSKRVTIEVELEGAIDERAHDIDDFVEDLVWAVKEYINERIDGFSEWNKGAIIGLNDRKSFLWANSVVDALERTRDGVKCRVEDVEYTEVES